MLTVQVALPVPLPRAFDYLPEAGRAVADYAPGTRVRVPFGRRTLTGLVLGSGELSGDPGALREIGARLDDAPLVDAELLASLRWAAGYYGHPLGEALTAALPTVLRQPSRRAPRDPRPLGLTDAGRALLAAPPARAAKLVALLAALASGPRARESLVGTSATLRTALARGLVAPAAPPAQPAPLLRGEQRAAVDSIVAARDAFNVLVLEGVTGSGKTEVYLAAIADAIARGKQSLVLVPEIGLTPQALSRYRARLGVPVLALHSGLADGERAAGWLAAARGEADVVLGTRSAVFAPLPRAGLIVVDEEHDASYKQRDGFRYHARDLAIVRARALGVPVVLGSATPSLETLANVREERYRMLSLRERATGARPPDVALVDLRNQRLHEGLSKPLLDAIAACIGRGEQALVFRNRRGYAPLLTCHACGWHASCERCDRSLTVHRGAAELRCHHCGHVRRQPPACPECGGELVALGIGTERLAAALRERFPDVPVLRVDRDTTQRKDAFADVLRGLEADHAAILVGTQMLAKGHDLPNLTLAAIVDADEGLFSADFRGPERLAQLVIQVAGRAGRGAKPGRVLVQTHQPAHPLFTRLLAGGYRAVADDELREREALGLPPFAHLALLRAEAHDANAARAFLERALALLGTRDDVSVRGPLPAPMPRRAGYSRLQLLLESPRRAALRAALDDWLPRLYEEKLARKVRWGIDVDPVDLY